MIDPTEALHPGHSKALRYVLLAIASVGILGGLTLFATAPDPASLPPAQAQAPLLRTLQLEAHPIASRARISGLLEPRRHVDLFAEIDGRVIEVGADELDRVEADQLLLRMDPLLAQIAIQRALAAVERAESQGVLAEANLKRNQGLADLDAASRAALDTSEDAFRQARASRLEAEASLAEAQDRLAKKTVRAPFAGVLREFPVEAGEYVRLGERVAELLDVDQLELSIGLTDNQVIDVVLGATVAVEVVSRPGEIFSGRIDGVGGAIDSETRKFPVRIELDNQDGRLLPGMVAVVDLVLGQGRSEMTLPLDAVMDEFGLKQVFVVTPDGEGGWVAHKRRIDVHTIPFLPTELGVTAGLVEGDYIAVSSIRQLRDGMAVRVMEESGRPTR